MFLKYLVFLFNIFPNVCELSDTDTLLPTNYQELIQKTGNVTDSILNVNNQTNSVLSPFSTKCVQKMCKYTCFNSSINEIERDILTVSKQNNNFCSTIKELRLYNYKLPDNKIAYGFLGNYSDKVEALFIISAAITNIEAGAFANGKFQKVYLENIQLKELKKDFFQGISQDFNSLSIIQKEIPPMIQADFLYLVKYQIKYLTLQAGLKSVQGLTGGEFLLNDLKYVDFSNNDFGSEITSTDFGKVPVIEHMNLSHCNLEYLPSYLFVEFAVTLEYLDLSFNKLKTISRTIFGWHAIPRDLQIYAAGNEWSCSCDLQLEMKNVFISWYNGTGLLCSEPNIYKNWSVFDNKICNNTVGEIYEPSSNTELMNMPTTAVDVGTSSNGQTTNTYSSYSYSITENDETEPLEGFMKLNCLGSSLNKTKRSTYPMQRPFLTFNVTAKDNMEVHIVINSLENSFGSFFLIWFSKVATNYYKMEINYNEYGLGCYHDLFYASTVKYLIPETAYTFCLVLKQQMTVSPFNCKSVFVSNNQTKQNTEWLPHDIKTAGLSLIIFGVIIFLYAGILMIYVLLKHKPILLKDNMRVMRISSNESDLVIVPEQNSVDTTIAKEERLSSYGFENRRKSTGSVASSRSYMSTNLYEVIPVYKRIIATVSAPSNLIENKINTGDFGKPDSDSCYLTPLETIRGTNNFIEHAEIPCRPKENVNDNLPKIEADHPPFFCAEVRT